MKRIFSVILLLLVAVFAFSGCTNSDMQESNNENIQDNEIVGTQPTNQETTSGSIPEPPSLPED